MIVNLTGILDDGTPLAPGVPPNPRKAITIVQGQDVTLVLRVLTPMGVEVPLASPTTLLFTAKKRPTDSKIFDRAPAAGAGSSASFLLTPADTKPMEPGLYVYDIWLTADGKRNPVVPLSPLYIEATSTPPP